MYYFIADPPYFLLIAGLLAGITSGLAFETTLKQMVKEWSKNRSSRNIMDLQGIQLFTPFLGISGGVTVFLSSGLEIFGFPSFLAYTISLPLTIFIGWLVWSQLGKVLSQIQQGGSEALDLDSMR